MITKCRHQSSLCKQQFNIPGFMAVLHSRFTVIACRESWTRKTLLKIIGVLSAVKLNKLPTRGDSIWTNQSQWNGTQIKKVMDLPTPLFDLSTLHVLQTNYSCRRGGKTHWLKLMCKWQTFTWRTQQKFLLTYTVGKQWVTHHALSPSPSVFSPLW